MSLGGTFVPWMFVPTLVEEALRGYRVERGSVYTTPSDRRARGWALAAHPFPIRPIAPNANSPATIGMTSDTPRSAASGNCRKPIKLARSRST